MPNGPGTYGPGQVGPWTWAPPEWDTSAGTPEQALQIPDVWPPAGWGAPDEFASPMLPDPTAEAPPGLKIGKPRNPDRPDDVVVDPTLPPGLGQPPAPATARAGMPQDERARPTLLSPEEEDSIEIEDEPWDADQIEIEPNDGTEGEIAFSEEESEAAGSGLSGREDWQRLADLDPEAFAVIQAKRAGAREEAQATRMLEEAQRQRTMLEDNESRRVKATEIARNELAGIATEAKALADGSPFERWWSSRDTGQKLAGYVSAIFGGFLQARTGRNSGLDFMMKLAEDDANEKWMALRERRGVAQDQLGMVQDDYKAREAFRLASYEQVARTLEAEMASLDPKGDQAMKIAEAVQGVRAQQAKMAAAAEVELYNRADKVIQRDQEQQRIDIEAFKAKDAAVLARARLARAGAGKKADQAFVPGYFKALGLEQPPDKPDGTGWTMKEYENWSGLAKAQRPEAADRRVDIEAEEKTAGRTINLPGGGTFQAFPDVAPKLRKQIGQVVQYVQINDAMIRAIEKHGWSSDTLKSKEWRQAQSLWADAALTKKNVDDLGVLAGPDIDIIGKAMGTKDPTEFDISDSVVDGLRQSRATTINRINNELKYEGGYKGPRIAIPELTNRALQETAELGDAGKRVKAIEAADAKGSGRPAWVTGITGDPTLPARKAKFSKDVESLIIDARWGDPAALAGIAKLARTRPVVAKQAIALGLDLSDHLAPDEWAEMQAAAEGK